MKELSVWLRRTIAISAIAVLAAIATAPVSAGASQAPALIDAVAQDAGTTGDIGVQHVGETWFTGFGCTFHGRSGPSGSRDFAVTAVASGSGCPNVMVRAFVCTGSSCFTTAWRSGPQAEYWAPSGQRIVTSFHKCVPCTLTWQINHNH